MFANTTLQKFIGSLNWLFYLVQNRLVTKTCIKLLLVFVEYNESNAEHFIHGAMVSEQKMGKSNLFIYIHSEFLQYIPSKPD